MAKDLTNWAGNIVFSAEFVHRPTDVAELQRVVAASPGVRALGSGHSFNRIADTSGHLVSVAELPASMDIDSATSTVQVSAGVRYGELARSLHASGYALPNLGSLPHISVAGACATGTHGSGDANRSLPAAVSEIEFVTATGDIERLTRAGDEHFCGSVVALGCLGVVTSLTLDVVPTFEVAQVVYDELPPVRLFDGFDTVFAAGYSVSVFTTWGRPRSYQVWVKRRSDDVAQLEGSWLGAVAADGPRHPIPGVSPVNCTEQLGVPGAWHERLPHFRLAFTPSSGDELQSEYLLPRAHALDALAALDRISDVIAPAVQISEIRTVAADDLWLSPCYGRETVAMHFTWISDAGAVAPAVAAVEEALAPYDARPHWGKVFSTAPEALPALYEHWDDFAALMAEYDPAGKFRNDWVATLFPRTDL
ncbi:MAG: D-arabinono-1,4-lactone oxidase [Mycobacteriales bacterium]